MKKAIYTDHTRERMYLRRVSEGMVQKILDSPDEHKKENVGDTQFIKTIKRGSSKMPVPDQGNNAWLVKTVWVRGEQDPNWFIKVLRMLQMRLFNR